MRSRRADKSETLQESTRSQRTQRQKRRSKAVTSVVVAAGLVLVIVFTTAGSLIPNNNTEIAQAPVSTQEPAQQPLEGTLVADKTIDEPQDQVVSGELAAAQPEPTEEPVVVQPPKQYKELLPETNHPDVIDLQSRLIDLHYMDNDEPTDYYGPATKQAVEYFQRKNDLPMDGVAGASTQDKLFSDDAKPYSVSLGASGPDVESVQQRLGELGYQTASTGYFGTETEKAVKYFQRMNNLADDGSVGYNTKEVLYSSKAEPAEKPVETEKPSEQPAESLKESAAQEKPKESAKQPAKEKQPEPKPAPAPAPKPEPTPAPEQPAEGGGTSHVADAGSVDAFIAAAMEHKGKKYVLGGKGPDVFDCSGFVYYALSQSGNKIGYMTSGGWANSSYATVNSMGELQRGDIICFKGHVGIYLGDNTMIDASSSNGSIVVRSLGSWARDNFINGKRPL